MRPQLHRLDADILCLQEANGQEQEGQPRQLLALQELIEDTQYADYQIVSRRTEDGEQVYDECGGSTLPPTDFASHSGLGS